MTTKTPNLAKARPNNITKDELDWLAEKRYRTYKASRGRKLCKKKKFKADEIACAMLNTQIYSKRVALSMDTRLTQLNLNTIVLGGSGAGKSRYYVKPNLLQANSSYVVTDPSGELLMSVGKFLESQGYVIKCLNIEDMGNSMRYNPFAYVYEDADIPLMVDALISNIEGPKKGGGDNKFWDETSRTLLIAICGYLFETQPMEKRNFTNVVKLIELMDASDDRQEAEDELDKLFNDLEKANPGSYAVSNYKVIKSAGTGKTAQNIIISTLAIFARFFKLDKIANLTYTDELHLEEIGQKKCALFIITPQANTTYNFLASELYTQLLDILYKQGHANAKAKNSTSVAVDVPVRFLIDEAANVGTIPHLENTISTCRKYNIAISLIYQNKSQIEALFEKKWEVLVGNCDTMVFLGGIDQSTVKMISERLGKGTINTRNNTINRGKNGGGSSSYQQTGRELLTPSEVEQTDGDYCIIFIRSQKPFFDLKYPLESHPNYKVSGDADEKFFYRPEFNIKLDHAFLNSLAVRRVGEPGYIEPERAEWATDEEIRRVELDQQKRREAAGGNKKAEAPKQNEKSETEEFIEKAVVNAVKPAMNSAEKERVEKVIREKNINLGPDEMIKIFAMSEEEALKMIELKDGWAPDLEFKDDDYPVNAEDIIKNLGGAVVSEGISESKEAEDNTDSGSAGTDEEIPESEDDMPFGDDTDISQDGFDPTAGFDPSMMTGEEPDFDDGFDEPEDVFADFSVEDGE